MKKLISRKHREWLFGYFFIGIWIIGFLVFSLTPIIQSLYYSTKNIRISSEGLQVVQSLGFKNYQNAVFYVYYLENLWKYIMNILISIPTIIVFSIIIALLLNQKIRFRGLFRTIYFLPVVISSGPVLAKIQGQGATSIPSLEGGNLYDLILTSMPEFISGSINNLFGKMVVIMWFTGVPVLIFLSGLQKNDKAIYESAAIDGASMWESFWKITLPSLKPLINISIIFSIVSISIFSSNDVMKIIDSKKLTEFGYSNALAWIYFLANLLVLGLLLLIVNMKKGRKRTRRRY